MPNNVKAKRRRREANIPDYAIKVNGRWYDYRRLEPLGTLLGAAADIAEAWKYLKKEDHEHFATMLALAFSQAVISKTYMRGINDFLNVLTQPERYATSWEHNLVGSVIPSALNFAGQSTDPYIRDTRPMGEMEAGDRFALAMRNALMARLPKTKMNPEFNRESLPVARDSWGEERKNPERLFPGAPTTVATEAKD